MLFQELDRSFSFKVDGYEFKGLFPTPKDERDIDIIVSQRLGNTPLNSIPAGTYNAEFICSTLNYVTRNGGRPEEIKDFSDVYDYDFTIEVFKKYRELKEKFDEKLKKNNRAKTDTRTSSQPGERVESVSDEKLQSTAKRIQ